MPRVLLHFKPSVLGNGWTRPNPATCLWPLDLLQYLYLVLRVCHWFQEGFFFSRFSNGHISRLCCYISLQSTHLLGRSVLGIKRSHTKIKSDLLTPTHCMVSCELVLVDTVTAESICELAPELPKQQIVVGQMAVDGLAAFLDQHCTSWLPEVISQVTAARKWQTLAGHFVYVCNPWLTICV